ncbi:MAG TPA: hypothetical protein PKN32_06780 [Bacteroidales bacterium]|nr:hypothetical protein [Bacteroidales bacterium]
MNKTIFKYLSLIGFIFIIESDLLSQESYIKDRWDIKIGHAQPIIYKSYNTYFQRIFNTRQLNTVVEANYGITEYFTIGAYLGHSPIKYWYEDSNDPNLNLLEIYQAFFLGAKTNFHIFPLFIKHNDFRFDLYLTGKAGGYYYRKAEFEYFVGAGFTFYPWKHVGVYTEYGYGNFMVNSEYFRFGLVLKFNQ